MEGIDSCAPSGRNALGIVGPVGAPLPAVEASHRLPSLAPAGPSNAVPSGSASQTAESSEEPRGCTSVGVDVCSGALPKVARQTRNPYRLSDGTPLAFVLVNASPGIPC